MQLGGRILYVHIDANDIFDSTAPGSAFNAGAPGFEKSDVEHMFNFGVRRSLTESLSTFVNFGQSIRVANVDDINQLSFPAPLFTAVREFTDLEPQRSRHIDLGLTYRSKKVNAAATAYLIKLRNEIHFNSATFLNENLDPTERKGFEFQLNVKATDKMTTSLNYAHAKATFETGAFAGNTVPLVPDNTANINVNYELFSGLNINGGWNYIGEKFFDNDQTNDFGQKISSYSTIDSKISFEKGGLDISFSANNILDEKAFDSGVRSTFTAGVYNALPLPERNFFLSIGYTFK
jgi:iron complex outermembrane receptor protein